MALVYIYRKSAWVTGVLVGSI